MATFSSRLCKCFYALTVVSIYSIVSLFLCTAFVLGISHSIWLHFTDRFSPNDWHWRNCTDYLDLQFVHRRNSTGFVSALLPFLRVVYHFSTTADVRLICGNQGWPIDLFCRDLDEIRDPQSLMVVVNPWLIPDETEIFFLFKTLFETLRGFSRGGKLRSRPPCEISPPSVQRVASAGRKPQNRPLIKLNTGALLPVKTMPLYQ